MDNRTKQRDEELRWILRTGKRKSLSRRDVTFYPDNVVDLELPEAPAPPNVDTIDVDTVNVCATSGARSSSLKTRSKTQGVACVYQESFNQCSYSTTDSTSDAASDSTDTRARTRSTSLFNAYTNGVKHQVRQVANPSVLKVGLHKPTFSIDISKAEVQRLIQ